MSQKKDEEIPLRTALIVLGVVIIVTVSLVYRIWEASSQASDSATTKPRATSASAQPTPKPTSPPFPEMTFYVRAPAGYVSDYNEVDIYGSFEVAGVEKTFDYDNVKLSSCRNDKCSWYLGPFTIDRGSWVYLTAYNDSIIECEIIVNGKRLDAADSYGSFATCSGRAR